MNAWIWKRVIEWKVVKQTIQKGTVGIIIQNTHQVTTDVMLAVGTISSHVSAYVLPNIRTFWHHCFKIPLHSVKQITCS